MNDVLALFPPEAQSSLRDESVSRFVLENAGISGLDVKGQPLLEGDILLPAQRIVGENHQFLLGFAQFSFRFDGLLGVVRPVDGHVSRVEGASHQSLQQVGRRGFARDLEFPARKIFLPAVMTSMRALSLERHFRREFVRFVVQFSHFVRLKKRIVDGMMQRSSAFVRLKRVSLPMMQSIVDGKQFVQLMIDVPLLFNESGS